MTVHMLRGPDTGYEDFSESQLFTRYEQYLFSKVVALAEKAGKHVDLLVVPGTNVFDAIAQTAANLDMAEIWAGRSSVMAPDEQAKHIGDAWERLPRKPSRQVTIHVVDPDGMMQRLHARRARAGAGRRRRRPDPQPVAGRLEEWRGRGSASPGDRHRGAGAAGGGVEGAVAAGDHRADEPHCSASACGTRQALMPDV